MTVGARAPLLEYWCREALRTSPGVEQAMVDFVAVRTARCPTVLTAAQQRNFASPYRLTFQHGWHYDYLDVDVIAAIAAVLENRPAHREIQRMLLAFSVPPEGIDLAYPPFYLWEPLERCYPDVMVFEDLMQWATHRAPWPVTSFCLICDATRKVDLTLTARLPTVEQSTPCHNEPVRVTVNGQPTGVVAVGPRWGKEGVRLHRQVLKEGINKVSLHWPMPSITGEAALAAASARLERGLEADVHPIFGEIFVLVAQPC